jgi:peptide methionine sulfoxide reductase MsrB
MNKINFTREQWRQRLTPEQYRILRREGTERAFSRFLHDKKDKGLYKCAGCGTPLFTSDMKFDSGTGWPFMATPVCSININYPFQWSPAAWSIRITGAVERAFSCVRHISDQLREKYKYK